MRFNSAKSIDVIVVSVCEGEGVEDNPFRVVDYYMTERDDGEMELLFKKDPMEDELGGSNDRKWFLKRWANTARGVNELAN